ncbi:unnamed protein product [Ectocarpus sp. 12 AP-2014]
MSTSIGMMDPAYFVGRKEILDWLNSYLSLNLSKVEETCSGAVACQLVDSLFPGKVPMSKVNWDARNDSEYINNYKVLQSAFDRLHIDKHIDVQRLTRGKYMDNLEFMQWFKNFHDTTGAMEGYDAVERRSKGRGGAKYGGGGARRPVGGQAASRASRPAASTTRGAARSSSTASAAAARAPASTLKSRAAPARSSAPAPSPDPQLVAKCDELTQERDELLTTMAAVEKERDFYFDKLRDIELLFQNHEQESGESDLTKNAFKILYATDEDHEQAAEGEEPLEADQAQVTALAGDTEDLLAEDGDDQAAGVAGVDLQV